MHGMMKQIQLRSEDLAERLLIFELEMRRCRTLEQRLAAYRDFGRVVDQIDELRRDAEEVLQVRNKDDLFARLDRKAASIMRSPAYRIAEWFETSGRQLAWFIEPVTSVSFGQ
jgi:hypothetical protein